MTRMPSRAEKKKDATNSRPGLLKREMARRSLHPETHPTLIQATLSDWEQ